MASVRQLKELFQAISKHDWETVEDAARQIVRSEEERGHHSAARTLNGALSTNGASRRTNGHTSAASPLGPLGALMPIVRDVSLQDVVLKKNVASELNDVILEWKNRVGLQQKGLRRRSRLLFHGPPGCGKSMTACALGNELSLPVFVVRFDAIIAAFLGQTAVNLRQLFQFVESTPCILLIDELDALGRSRGDRMDVGELDRIVIALMQELEHSKPAGLMIATSNLPKGLDRALWRRFDFTIEFPLPTKTQLAQFARDNAKVFNIRLSAKLKTKLTSRISFAEAESLLESEARRVAIQEL
jgi:SpoVK/Ycf46/Vps4 family AAA+-type ATPase